MKRLLNIMSWRKPEKKAMKFVAIVFALTMTIITIPTATWAGANVFHYSFKGQSASASFSNISSDGCTYTYVYVSATDGSIKTQGKPEAQSAAYVYVEKDDYCSWVFLYADGYANLAENDFQIDKKLTSAILNTTINVYDYYSGNTFPVNVSISWTGSGDLFSGKFHSHFQGPEYRVNYRSNGTSRYAGASGTVSDGTTNFTPNPSDYAYTDSSNNAEVDIYKQ